MHLYCASSGGCMRRQKWRRSKLMRSSRPLTPCSLGSSFLQLISTFFLQHLRDLTIAV